MRFIVTGTGTGVGKTVFAAALTAAIGASYWKPIQSGNLDNSDSMTVARLAGLPQHRILAEAYRLTTACSPHESAALDGVTIAPERLQQPVVSPLVIEGAGGPLVPLTDSFLQIDLFAKWRLSTILVATTSLGTINHSLLSIEALRARYIPIVGVAFVGPPNHRSEQAICDFGNVRRLGCLPHLQTLDAKSLAEAFHANFDLQHFSD